MWIGKRLVQVSTPCTEGDLVSTRSKNVGKELGMTSRAVKIVDGGKLVIPSSFRKELGMKTGDTVIVDLVDGTLQVRPFSAAIRHAQTILRQYVPEGVSLSDELIADRRAEAAREEADG